MEFFNNIIIIVLFAILIFLTIKIYIMKKAIKEINISIDEILKSDTNNLITISSGDRVIKELTGTLNDKLKMLRDEKLKFENGNQKLQKTITNISHDMRTPLTVISGYLDFIKIKSDKDEKYLNIIKNKIKELTFMTEQLFEFSTTMDIGLKVHKEEQCLNELLEEVLINYYNILTEKNVIPNVQICNNRIYRKLDKNSVMRAFENILSNVIKYSDGDFKVSLNKNGKIVFSNKALSLDKISVEKIFNRYYTVENAKKSTGIGLDIAKQLIEGINDGKVIAKYINNHLIIEISFWQFTLVKFFDIIVPSNLGGWIYGKI